MGKREVTIGLVREWAAARGLSRFQERVVDRRVLSEGAEEICWALRSAVPFWTVPFESCSKVEGWKTDQVEYENFCEEIYNAIDSKESAAMELIEFKLGTQIETVVKPTGESFQGIEANMLLHSTQKKFWVLVSRRKK